jgi:hypothetical protein
MSIFVVITSCLLCAVHVTGLLVIVLAR